MKQKTKVLLSSLATIAMCASVVVGGTFALFTSEDEVNVSVSSGHVKITATVDEVFTGTQDGRPGFVQVKKEENYITLENLIPMDTVSFDIEVKNESSIPVQYRTIITSADGVELYSFLDIQVGATTFVGTSVYSEWGRLEVDESFTVPVTITLPKETPNDAQDLSTTITYRVEAVQGNAGYQAPQFAENELPVYTPTDLQLLSKAVSNGRIKGKTVLLMNDIDMAGVDYTPIGTGKKFEGVFDGQGYTVSNLTVEGGEAVGFLGNVHGTVKNLTLQNASVKGWHYVGGIVGYIYGSVLNCSVVDSEIVGYLNYDEETELYERGDKVGGIVGYLPEAYAGYTFSGNKVVNTSVRGFRDVGGLTGALTKTSVEWIFENNTVEASSVGFVYADGPVSDGDKNGNIGALVGRYVGASVVDATNRAIDVTVETLSAGEND